MTEEETENMIRKIITDLQGEGLSSSEMVALLSTTLGNVILLEDKRTRKEIVNIAEEQMRNIALSES